MANTPRPGELVGPLSFNDTGRETGKAGNYSAPTSSTPLFVYKNRGWYAAGSVWESWLSSPSPSITPPTGHTLTQISYSVLQQ